MWMPFTGNALRRLLDEQASDGLGRAHWRLPLKTVLIAPWKTLRCDGKPVRAALTSCPISARSP